LIESKKRNIETLKKSGQNKFAIFGRSMENLMAAIATNARKFKKQPRGPIAAFITVTDPKFNQIVEFVLNSNKFLVTFMVDNNDDYLLLKELIKNAYAGYNKFMPSIKVNSFAEKVNNSF
jgi:chromosome segregation ATPase